ncbi:putative GAL7-UDP-glucose--hexose-1-phosphate uridylyltransferase [Exidia glandulosa HHB12029]|uniref:Galactose-1-phosphate uridylyltransferase n=1 Tax=Exidia glandulosa HHB12029 TaxID=1314781 RepID=A0A165BVQ2_EXIGL|nr:putative GAL7-UDP-glucose--hexose-1-phosphate uridylyltransferase [Exidia glandulosa HHB12029]
MAELPHRRFNPLLNEYVLVSPQRNKRPWQGQVDDNKTEAEPQYDPKCYLCPGNVRSGKTEPNPQYESTWTFPNDFPALLPHADDVPQAHPLLKAEAVTGACDVIIYNPRHDLLMARMSREQIRAVIKEWQLLYDTRGHQEGINNVQIFETRGAMMGSSNPHPHGQAWSTSSIPTEPATELRSLKKYAEDHDGQCLLCEYASLELREQTRVVFSNEHWVAVVPWWATWPFEVLLLPHHRHIVSIADLNEAEQTTFADALSRITVRYDNVFKCTFPYVLGIHQRPIPKTADTDPSLDIAHLHVHFYPPLLRSATVRKFPAGFEMLAEIQRDLTPETAAQRLRECSEVHYLDGAGTEAPKEPALAHGETSKAEK